MLYFIQMDEELTLQRYELSDGDSWNPPADPASECRPG